MKVYLIFVLAILSSKAFYITADELVSGGINYQNRGWGGDSDFWDNDDFSFDLKPYYGYQGKGNHLNNRFYSVNNSYNGGLYGRSRNYATNRGDRVYGRSQRFGRSGR